MSTYLSKEDAQRLFDEMRRREQMGCTSMCLDRDLWFTRKNSGSDLRSPSSTLARYLRIKHGVEISADRNVWLESFMGTDRWPRLSDEHPICIEWSPRQLHGESELSELRR